ncbi:MAG: carboxypeptidase regulatory-like domain-containing protein [Candidatus Saliniplasma sp.]
MRFSLSSLSKKGNKQKSSSSSKLEKHWGTIVSLLGIFIIALLVRCYFAFNLATSHGSPFMISGGSDAYYYRRIIDFITTNHYHLLNEPMLNYPIGRINPRPPLFAWINAVMGYILSPLVGDVRVATEYVFLLSVGVWGALTIFPTYLIGRDTFGKKAGLTAALLLAISAAHLQRGVITNGDHDAFVMFFGVTGFYFFMRALKGIDAKRNWVQDWADRTKIKAGLSDFISENKRSLLYAAMTGMCFGAVALSWQGYAYLMAIVLVYYGIQLFIDKFKKKDSLGVTMCVGVALSLTLLLAAPFYISTGVGFSLPTGIGQFFDVPLLLFLSFMVVGIYFTVTRDLPWLFVLGVFAVAASIFTVLGFYFFRNFIESVIGGGGYFIQTPVYTTIAEAQSAEFSNLVLSAGVLTFFLSFTGIALALWHLKGNWNPAFIFVLIWTAFALYMAISAARFMFNAAPAFALPAGWVTALAVDKANFPEVAWRIKSYRGNLWKGIYEGFKIKHISIILVVLFLIFIPNVTHAFDAGIPYERKGDYDEQIYQSLPEFLRPPEDEMDETSSWYLGAFGYSLDDPGEYWPSAWKWLRNQDTDLKPEDRPGFLSWWDYGFEAAGEGQHPTVADNFQTAYRFAGNVLMAQNESEMISLLTVRMLEKDINENGEFSEDTRNILEEHIGEVKTEELEAAMQNPRDEKYREEVFSNPDRYHPRDEDIHFQNVKYAYTMGLLSYEDVHDLADLYREVCIELEGRIKYLAIDTRLFPLSGQQTGVFYAPVKLSGHRIDDEHGMRTPTDFYTINFVDSQNNVYSDPDEIPEDAQIVDQRIEYQSMFYNSALYNIFVGYSGSDIGMEEGIPGMNQQLQEQQPMPSWNMTYFKMAHRTAYYNPYDDFENNTEAWRAISYDEALEKEQGGNGTVDTSGMAYMRQGAVFLENYDGAIVEGQVKTEEGEPVQGATVTVLDEYTTVKQVTTTDEDGYYRAVAPPGENTLAVTQGQLERPVLQIRKNQLGVHEFTVTEEMAMRKEIDSTRNGTWDYLIEKDFEVDDSEIDGHIYIEMEEDEEESNTLDDVDPSEVDSDEVDPGEVDPDEVDPDEVDPGEGDPGEIDMDPGDIPGGTEPGETEPDESYDEEKDKVVNGEVTITHMGSGKTHTMETTDGYFKFTGLVPGEYSFETDVEGAERIDNVSLSPGDSKTSDIKVSTGEANLNIEYGEGINSSQPVDVEARHSKTGLTYDTVIEGEGSYPIKNMINGRYELTVKSDGYTFKHGGHKFEIAQEEIQNISLSIAPAERVNGSAVQDGDILEGQSITVTGTGDSEFQKTIKTDTNGDFSVKLPEGIFRLYGRNREGTQTFVYMDLISVPHEEDIDANFEKGYVVEGETLFEDSTEDSYNILFEHESGKEVKVTSNSDGRFRTHLIQGSYDVYGWKDGTFTTLVSLNQVTVDKSRNLNLEAERGTKLSGTVKRHMEELAEFQDVENLRSKIEIKVDKDWISAGRSNLDGEYDVFVPERRSTLRFSKDGFENFEIEYTPGEEPTSDVSLKADDVTVSGDIHYETYYPETLELKFEAVGNGAVDNELSVFRDDYAVELQPGVYDLVVDHTFDNDDQRLWYNERIEVSQDRDLEWDISLKEQIRLTGTIKDEQGIIREGNMSFLGPETKNITSDGEFDVYILPGSYGLRVANDAHNLTAHTSFEVGNASSIDVVLKETMEYSTTVRYKGEAKSNVLIEVENLESGFVETEKTDETGDASFSLAPDEYRLNIDHIEREPVEGVLSRIRYRYNIESYAEHLPSSISLTRELYNATLSGTVKAEGVGVETEIEFISTSPESISTSTITDADGDFDVELFHGLYTLYISHEGSRPYSYLGTFAMEEEDDSIDIDLERASVLEGRVRKGNIGEESEVNFQRISDKTEKTIGTDIQGDFEILLPRDEYNITAEKTIAENRYRAERDMELASSRTLDLELKLVREYGIEIEDIPTKRASQGDTVTFEVDITNTGNVIDEYEMSAEKSVWNIEFSPQKFELAPGRTRSVKITVQVDDNASVAHPPVSFEVKSHNSEEEEKQTIPFEIEPVYGVQVLPEIERKVFERGSLHYTLKVRNTGNVEEEFRLSIQNDDELMNRGWNATLSDERISVTEAEDSQVNLTLKPLRAGAVRDVEVVVTATSTSDAGAFDMADVRAEVPSLESDTEQLEMEGERISFEKYEFSLETWQWVAIILLISSIALYVMKKERWI